MASINKNSFPSYSMLAGNSAEEDGATSWNRSLESYETLTEFNLSGEDKREKTHKLHPSTIHSFSLSSTGNKIGDTGATSLSESLKSNTTLTELNLKGENKRKKTHKLHPSTIHSFHFSSYQQTTRLETQEQHH